ncbi:MAG TPA: hypothetical protein VFV08_03700 [Puia sp.]|nr:hypothetical protein [Puia sp.]
MITIDVEPDCSSNWHYADPLSFNGISVGIGQILQPLFNKFNAAPTYLLNNVVIEDTKSVGILQGLEGRFELGAHLHPEFIEPGKQFENYAGKKGAANSCFYPPEIEFEKIKNITNLFANKFGYRPTSFRTGRYSAGPNTIDSLSRLGYLVDTSVTPHVCWNDATREKPVDFRFAPEQPYFMNKENLILEDKNGDLLQVPISIELKKRIWLKEALFSMGGFRRPIQKYRPIWLRPYFSSPKQLIEIANHYFEKYRDREYVVLNMMFHNVEVMPGLSPYTASEKDCQEYLMALTQFLKFCQQEKAESLPLSDIYHVVRK